jgi:hypothetical protein
VPNAVQSHLALNAWSVIYLVSTDIAWSCKFIIAYSNKLRKDNVKQFYLEWLLVGNCVLSSLG